MREKHSMQPTAFYNRKVYYRFPLRVLQVSGSLTGLVGVAGESRELLTSDGARIADHVPGGTP